MTLAYKWQVIRVGADEGLAFRGLEISIKGCGLHPVSLGKSLKESKQRSGLIRVTHSAWGCRMGRGRKASQGTGSDQGEMAVA